MIDPATPTEGPVDEQPPVICAEDQAICPTDPTRCKEAGSLRCIEAEIPDPEIQIQEAEAISGLLDIDGDNAQNIVAESLEDMEKEEGAPTPQEETPGQGPEEDNNPSPEVTPSVECVCPEP